MIGRSIILVALGSMFWGFYSSMRDIDAADQKLMEEIERTKEGGGG